MRSCQRAAVRITIARVSTVSGSSASPARRPPRGGPGGAPGVQPAPERSDQVRHRRPPECRRHPDPRGEAVGAYAGGPHPGAGAGLPGADLPLRAARHGEWILDRKPHTMGKETAAMSTVLRVASHGQEESLREPTGILPADLNGRIAMIQALIPLGLLAVEEALQQEVEGLVGPWYARGAGRPGHVRWSKERGAVYLLDQKVPVTYQRVRDQRGNTDVPLATYRALQQPRQLDEGVLRRVLHGMSCRRYRECAEAIPQAFGLSASSVSRRYIRATARTLQLCLAQGLGQRPSQARRPSPAGPGRSRCWRPPTGSGHSDVCSGPSPSAVAALP